VVALAPLPGWLPLHGFRSTDYDGYYILISEGRAVPE
jgi:hypothetical protein